MLLNKNTSLVANPVDINIRRSIMEIPEEHQLDFDSGKLIPVYINSDVVPGTTIKMKMSALLRLSTPIYPTMDTAYADVFFFSVPKRLVWEHFKEFKGENSNTYWTTPVEYTTPQIEAPSGGWNVCTVADYMGIPPGLEVSIDALPFRAYALVWNEWFRSESLTQPVSISFGDATVSGSNLTWTDYITDGSLGGEPLRVARFHDVFSSALFEPQAGVTISIPIDGTAPVYPSTTGNISSTSWDSTGLNVDDHISFGLKTANPNITGEYYYPDITGLTGKHNLQVNANNELTLHSGTSSDSGADKLVMNNLVADLGDVTGLGITIEALRESFAIQRILERINAGSRYIEVIKNCFGVVSPDARMQRPEYLGGKRFPLTMAEINQTSSTDAVSPLGNPGATSKTLMSDDIFEYSATEHCIILGLMCVRPVHTYAQGIARNWRKRTRFEYYWPDLANIGDQYIKNSEIYAQDDSVVDSDGNVVNDEPFGYAEAWYEYRVGNGNQVHGHMRPQVNQSLAVWNYADHYTSLPTLSTDWLYEDGTQIGRTIAVQNMPQIIADLFFDPTYVLPMPVVSIPSLDTRF